MAARPDLRTIDLLARLALGARRAGLELRLTRATPELRELIGLCGLAQALRVEPERQAEEREERLGAEEEGQLRDPPA